MPFVVGQWVRGSRFYGRRRELDEILGGPRNCLWVLGTRRVGKTSLLKQLEHLALTSPQQSWEPLFWDLQGADDATELDLTFRDALLDSEDRWAAHGIAVDDLADADLFTALGRLRRTLRASGRRLLLLLDEAEELIQIHAAEPPVLRKLRRAMQSTGDVRSVVAASPRLWALADATTGTSPFLEGFVPPLYLGPLDDADARTLVAQAQLAPEQRPRIGASASTAICRACGNHPFLIQMLGKRFLDLGDLDAAVAEVQRDRSVSFFCAVDYELLSAVEQRLLRWVAAHEPAPGGQADAVVDGDPDTAITAIGQLERLGAIRRTAEDALEVGNVFLGRWLRDTGP
jgi:hypothetical protein